MDWRQGPGGEPGDEPDTDAVPPRRSQHYGYHPDNDETEAGEAARDVPSGGSGTDGSPPAGGGSPAPCAGRDERLAWFAPGGAWEEYPPSAELAVVLESLGGSEWRCLGATAAELITMTSRWAALESWAGAGRLGVIRELIRREDKPVDPAGRDEDADEPDPWTESLRHALSLALASSVGRRVGRSGWRWSSGPGCPVSRPCCGTGR